MCIIYQTVISSYCWWVVPPNPYSKVCVCVSVYICRHTHIYTQVSKMIARASVSREFLESDMLSIFSFCILNTFYFLIFASTILVFVVHLCFFYRFRKMNKRLVPRRPLSASLGQLNEVGLPSTAILPEEGAVDLPSRKTPALPNGIVSSGNTVTQLIPRGTDPSYESSLKPGKIDHLSSSAPGSPPDLYVVFTNIYLKFLYWHKVEGRKNNQCFV